MNDSSLKGWDGDGGRWRAGAWAFGACLALAAPAAAQSEAAEGSTADGATATPGADAGTAPASASHAQYVLEEGQLVAVVDGARTPLAIAAPVVGVYHQGNRLYVARGPQGVALYRVDRPLEPALLREVTFPGSNVTGFYEAEGQVWAVLTSKSAVPLDEAVPVAGSAGIVTTTPPVATGTSAPPSGGAVQSVQTVDAVSPAAPVGVRAVAPGTVELDAGADAGVQVGDSYVIVRAVPAGVRQSRGFVGEERVAFAEVVAVSPTKALAQVSRSARVDGSELARRATAEDLKGHRLPPLVPNVGQVGVVLRPVVKVGTPVGAGFLAELDATYWGKGYFAGLRLQPLGLGFTKDGDVVSSAALVEGGYETPSFAVGLGLGAAWVNGDMDYMVGAFGASSDEAASDGPTTVTTTERQATHGAFALSQVVRLGSRDGLSFSLRNVLLLHQPADESQDGFIYGGTTGRLGIPVAKRTDLFTEGGGGVMGYWFFGVGTATWIVGNGSPGSWYLSASAGAAGIYGSREVTTTYDNGVNPPQSYTNDETVSVVGPMVSVGLTRRFGI